MQPEIYKDFKFGDTQVKYLYQGDTLVWPPLAPPDSSIEFPDIMLEWISNGNDSSVPNVYFNTGWNYTRWTSYEIKYSYDQDPSSTSALFGVEKEEPEQYDTGYYTKIGFYLNTGHNNLPGFKFGRVYSTLSGQYLPAKNTSYVVNMSPSYPYDNDTNYRMIATSGTGYTSRFDIGGYFTNGATHYLFASHRVDNSGTSIPVNFSPANTKIYYMKIYDNRASGTDAINSDVLYRFFIPVLHYDSSKGEYVPCFYEKITNRYYYNQGTDNVTYLRKRDYLLDYIMRDNSGTLSYTTSRTVNDKLLVNVGYNSWDSSTLLPSLGENMIFGTFPHGFYHPRASNTTQMAYAWTPDANNPNTAGDYTTHTYDPSVHIAKQHHCDHMAASMYTFLNTKQNVEKHLTRFYWLDIPYDNLNSTSTSIEIGTYDNNTLVDSSICLFGDSRRKAKYPTKIYYADFEGMAVESISGLTDANLRIRRYNTPGYSYIPVLHNNIACFYDITNRTYIYNTGPGTPKYLELG